MASNSFPLTTTRSQQHTGLNQRKPRLTTSAKRASFQFGRPNKDDESSEANQGDNSSSNLNPFRFNLGKLSDVKSLIPISTNTSTGLAFGNARRKDPGTVFVAGATGQVGVRVAQTLLQKGFSVRAGVTDLRGAQDLARLAAVYEMISKEQSKRLNAVESSFQDAESIAKAIGNAAKVVVTVGPGENGPETQVTTADALLVVQAAELAGVSHVAIIYDKNENASTYNVLDGITSFFSNLFAQSQPLGVSDFLEKVIQTTDVTYTFIKASLAEDFSPERSYNVVVSAEGSGSSIDAYKVAKMRIASLVADVFSNTAVAENKVVEVFTDPSSPSRPVDELFGSIPEDGRRKAYAETLGKAKAEEEARIAAEKAREAAEAAKELEKQVQKLSEQESEAANLAEEAKEKANAAGISVDGLLSRARDISSGLSFGKFGSQIATAVQNGADEKPNKVQMATVRGQAKARNLPPKKAAVKQPNANANANPLAAFALRQKQERSKKTMTTGKDPEQKTEVRKVFGGLFQQETIYVDED